MGQRQGILLALLLLAGGMSLPASTQPAHTAGVVFSLKIRENWAHIIGADSPRFTLYEDRSLIYFNPGEKRYEFARLTEGEYTSLKDEILLEGLWLLKSRYSRVHWTDQDTYYFYFGGNTPRMVEVYGHPTAELKFGSVRSTVYEIPRSLRLCFDTVAAYRHPQARPWLPEKIEVLVFDPGSTPHFSDWPDRWPSPRLPGRAYSIFLPQDLYEDFRATMKKSSWGVTINGKALAVSHGMPIPGEKVFGRYGVAPESHVDERPGACLYSHLLDVLWLGGKLSPLQSAAREGELNRIRSLIAEGADVNAKETDGNTALHWATHEGHAEAAKILLAHGAHVNARQTNGFTALHGAAWQDRQDIADLLITAGADRNARCSHGTTPLHVAVWWGKSRTAELLMEKGADVNARDKMGDTPLCEAAWNGDIGLARSLAQRGADVNAGNDRGITPLHNAARLGHSDVAEMLIHRGAHVNARDDRGHTPLHFATFEGYARIAKLLLAGGADANARTDDGYTPLECARLGGHESVLSRLLEQRSP
ncbi:MAG: hypothetical protein FJ280_00140 [Planctomycetes bacterium]|nr:hypothetical protein [Planctomycetota bacterium]